MENLKLAHPKQMALAVPANLKCGVPDSPVQAGDPDWAPLTYTFAGVWEVQPAWLEEHPVQRASARCARAGRIHRAAWTHSGRHFDSAWGSFRTRAGTRRNQSRLWRCAAPAAVQRKRPTFCARQVLSRWRICPAACCAGAPKAAPSKAAKAKRPRSISTPAASAPGKRMQLFHPNARAGDTCIFEAGCGNSFRQRLCEIDVAGQCNGADLLRDRFVIDGVFQPVVIGVISPSAPH